MAGNRKALTALVAAALTLFFGCKVQTSSRVYGVYSANYPAGTELLTLDKDGSYTQTVTIKGTGAHASSQGKWHWDEPSGFVILESGYIESLDALGRLRPDFAQPLKGLVDMPAVSCFGQVYIGTAQFVLYQKEPPPAFSPLERLCTSIL